MELEQDGNDSLQDGHGESNSGSEIGSGRQGAVDTESSDVSGRTSSSERFSDLDSSASSEHVSSEASSTESDSSVEQLGTPGARGRGHARGYGKASSRCGKTRSAQRSSIGLSNIPSKAVSICVKDSTFQQPIGDEFLPLIILIRHRCLCLSFFL